VSAAMLCMQSFAFDYSGNPVSNNYVQEWGKLKLVGNQLSSESGEPIQLRGWSTHGSWFKGCYDDKNDFEKMKKEGANMARIAMYINEGSGVDKAWVKNCIDYTAELGMYCIVDWHILKPGNPNAGDYSGYSEFFNEIGAHVKQKGYKHVIWEICNEPNEDVDGAPAKFHKVWDWVKRYAGNVLPIIAQYTPDAVVLVGTPQWDQDVTVAFQDPLEIKDTFKDLQLMYSFHHYAGDQQRYLGIMSGAAAFVPVFISEWGLSSHTGDSGCDTKAGDHMIQVANGQNLGGQIISWANWSWADKGETSGTFTGGGYNNMSFSDAGNYIRKKLKEGDNWKKCETTPYESAQVFDGKSDFILDLGAYDKGGQDNAYFDYDEDWACPGNDINNTKPCNAGNSKTYENFRPNEYFDLGYSKKACEGDNCTPTQEQIDDMVKNAYKTLGYIGNGEWITYTIDVKKAGDYDFEVYACDHKDFNTFGIAVDGKPGLVTENGDATEFQALYLPTCNGGDENGDYNVWGWVKPYNDYKKDIKHKIHFEEAGEHKLSFAFMTSFSGMGSFKIIGDPTAVEETAANAPVIAPNPAEGGLFNVSVSENSAVKVVNSLGAVVYSANVEANTTTTVNLNVVPGVYFVSVVGESNATTEKLIVK
ncbi:MAG: cellulase family glycosylhydrolase, partial [Bacteroidales bacterium]|nr:cellulase family glycosylhydrolase [Candidatus Scybalocola fimicaballi]